MGADGEPEGDAAERAVKAGQRGKMGIRNGTSNFFFDLEWRRFRRGKAAAALFRFELECECVILKVGIDSVRAWEARKWLHRKSERMCGR